MVHLLRSRLGSVHPVALTWQAHVLKWQAHVLKWQPHVLTWRPWLWLTWQVVYLLHSRLDSMQAAVRHVQMCQG